MRALCFLCFAAACSSSHNAGPDGTTGSDADHTGGDGGTPLDLGPLMPQETAGNKNAVMATPSVVAITWDGDPNRTDTEAFFHQYAASPAWAMQVSEYGVGALTVGTPRHLTGQAASTDAAIRQLLMVNLGGGNPAWGAPSLNTLYSFTLPVGTKYSGPFGANFCGGYHDDVIVGGVDVAYSIQLPCQFPPPITPLQVLTFTLAHELVEAVTDPRWEHVVAWGNVDSAHQVWTYVTDGELADLCEFADTFLWTDAPGMTYAIQRIWSNAAARAGTDPCIGKPNAAYYQSVPDQPDDVSITLFGSTVTTKGKKLALGTPGTITAHIAGTPGSGPFTVSATDLATLQGATTPLLKIVQPNGTYQLGDTVTIQVTPMAKDANLGGEAFAIATKPRNGGPMTYFYGLVAQ